MPAEGSRGEAETSGVRDLPTQARSKALVKPLGQCNDSCEMVIDSHVN